MPCCVSVVVSWFPGFGKRNLRSGKLVKPQVKKEELAPWLPPRVYIRISPDSLKTHVSLKPHAPKPGSSGFQEAEYELVSVVSHVTDPPDQHSPLNTINGEHLVAHVKVPSQYYQRVTTASGTVIDTDAQSFTKA